VQDICAEKETFFSLQQRRREELILAVRYSDKSEIKQKVLKAFLYHYRRIMTIRYCVVIGVIRRIMESFEIIEELEVCVARNRGWFAFECVWNHEGTWVTLDKSKVTDNRRGPKPNWKENTFDG